MKEKITTFINGLIVYDYILFGGVFVVFILFIVLSILVREKVKLSIFLILFAFITLFVGPTLGYMQMHKFLYKNITTLLSQKKLIYTEAIVVKASIKNISKFDFKSCIIAVSAYKVTGNKAKDFLFKYKPIKTTLVEELDIAKGEQREFKLFIEPFTYAKDYNISLEGKCR